MILEDSVVMAVSVKGVVSFLVNLTTSEIFSKCEIEISAAFSKPVG
jgi:hypothetical protein